MVIGMMAVVACEGSTALPSLWLMPTRVPSIAFLFGDGPSWGISERDAMGTGIRSTNAISADSFSAEMDGIP
jgi:hypothetical protein